MCYHRTQMIGRKLSCQRLHSPPILSLLWDKVPYKHMHTFCSISVRFLALTVLAVRGQNMQAQELELLHSLSEREQLLLSTDDYIILYQEHNTKRTEKHVY